MKKVKIDNINKRRKRLRYNKEKRDDFYKELEELQKRSYEGINEKGKDGDTILHQAVAIANQKTVKLLIEKGANVNEQNEKELTPLHVAATMGSVANMKILIEEGAKLNAVDIMGKTALHKAFITSAKGAIEELLKAGADREIRDELGARAIDYGNERLKGIFGKRVGINEREEEVKHREKVLAGIILETMVYPKQKEEMTSREKMQDKLKREILDTFFEYINYPKK